MMFTIFTADVTGNPRNCSYPHKHVIMDVDDLKAAICRDYVCAEYRNNYRNSNNFVGSDCLAMDCDNDHTEDPAGWKTPEDVMEAFPGVTIAVHFSRSHMLPKHGKAARPKFHVLFPIDYTADGALYSDMKKQVNSIFPFFDSNALDAARFFFGTAAADVAIYPGQMNLTEFLKENSFADLPDNQYDDSTVIAEGSRNATMSHYAGQILKRYGISEEAYSHYMAEAGRCDPPLASAELDAIWRSAERFYGTIAAEEGYIPSEQYGQEFRLKPRDYSDVGQAEVMAREYAARLRYSPATDFLVFNGSFWEESAPKAQAMAQELTDRQLEEAEIEIKKVKQEMVANGAWELLSLLGPKRAAAAFTSVQARSFQKYENAIAYRNYAIKRRDSKYISSVLREVRPKLEIDQRSLDADEFLLNTPSHTYDLRKGLAGSRDHTPSDYITKQTRTDPSDIGADLWQNALDTFFSGDTDLICYVQEIVGLAAIGKVFLEAVIIAYGSGRNGKSTFLNTLARVLGTYSGNMSADALTVGTRRNIKPEMAELKGKRLVIAAELEEGTRFNTATVKQLSSTDEIYAEKKYKAPFSFSPSHMIVLCTNHLPRVGVIDAGTWRRLIVIPFSATIDGKGDVKNYADYLCENAGGAVLSWIIAGAQRVIAKNYHIEQPKVVKDAIARYREGNNWLEHFLSDCCDLDKANREKSGELYNAYRNYCMQVGEYIRSTTDFYAALGSAGFERRKTNTGAIVSGLRLKPDIAKSDGR